MAEAIIQNASFAISEVGRQAQFVLQCAIEDRSMVGSYLELELPETPLKWMGGNRWSALHLSPGEWLLIGKSGNGRDMTDKTVAHTFSHTSRSSTYPIATRASIFPDRKP